jgi:hypothetical protein
MKTLFSKDRNVVGAVHILSTLAIEIGVIPSLFPGNHFWRNAAPTLSAPVPEIP